MPYTILVCDDNTLYGSQKRKIMQREKLFNKLWFLVAPYYNGHDMSQCTVTLRYLLPISKEFKTETLELSKEGYKEYLKYVLPIDTNLTKEWGDIELNLTFTMLDVDEYGNVVQRVRKTENHILNITKLPDWDSVIPDSALSALDQRIIKTQAQIQELEYYAEILSDNQVDNLKYNEEANELQLMAGNKEIGNKVALKNNTAYDEDGVPVVDFSITSGGDTNNEQDDEDNIVEF